MDWNLKCKAEMPQVATKTALQDCMYGYVRLCAVMYGYARLCTVMYGYARLCTVMHGEEELPFFDCVFNTRS